MWFSKKISQLKKYFLKRKVQSNLCITTTLETQNLWPLLTGGRCSEVALCYKNWNWDPKIVVANSGLTVFLRFVKFLSNDNNGHFRTADKRCFFSNEVNRKINKEESQHQSKIKKIKAISQVKAMYTFVFFVDICKTYRHDCKLKTF